MASVGARTFGISVGEPAGRKKTENEFDTQTALLKELFHLERREALSRIYIIIPLKSKIKCMI